MQTIQRNRQKGGTMLEMALTLVVFLSLFIGVLDIGEMFFVHQTLTDRARNAARWGARQHFQRHIDAESGALRRDSAGQWPDGFVRAHYC